MLGWILDAPGRENNVIEMSVQEELLEVVGARLVQDKLRQRWAGDPDATVREMLRSSRPYLALLGLLELGTIAGLMMAPVMSVGWWVYLVPLVPIELGAMGLLVHKMYTPTKSVLTRQKFSYLFLCIQQTLLCPASLLLLFLPEWQRLALVVVSLVSVAVGTRLNYGGGRRGKWHLHGRLLMVAGLAVLMPLLMPAIAFTFTIAFAAPLLAVAAWPPLEEVLEKRDVTAAELAAWTTHMTLGQQLLLPLHILNIPSFKFFGSWGCNVLLACILPFVVPTGVASSWALAAMLAWIVAALAQERTGLMSS